MPSINITADGNSSTISLPKQCEYELRLRGTIAVAFTGELQHSDTGEDDWEGLRSSPEAADPVILTAEFRTMLVYGGRDVRLVVADFAGSSGLTLSYDEYGQVQAADVTKSAIDDKKLLRADQEYLATNTDTTGADPVIFTVEA